MLPASWEFKREVVNNELPHVEFIYQPLKLEFVSVSIPLKMDVHVTGQHNPTFECGQGSSKVEGSVKNW